MCHIMCHWTMERCCCIRFASEREMHGIIYVRIGRSGLMKKLVMAACRQKNTYSVNGESQSKIFHCLWKKLSHAGKET